MGNVQGTAPTIAVVDDDAGIRDALSTTLSLEGFRVATYADGASFLSSSSMLRPDAVLLDIRMPGMDGIAVLHRMREQHYEVPTFVLSGHATIPLAVEAIRAGAYDVVEKPIDAADMVERLRRALSEHHEPASKASVEANFPGRDLLTKREQDVLAQIIRGASNKEAAKALGISHRTIEIHRARLMEKLDARNAADLTRIVLSGGQPR
mgnify:CR=1 FL=1